MYLGMLILCILLNRKIVNGIKEIGYNGMRIYHLGSIMNKYDIYKLILKEKDK